MSREFKFRLWDENAKWWLSRGESVELAFSQNFPERISAKLGFCLEQFTGLKDKNGKEIYEGDIIQEEIDSNSEMTDGVFIYEVYWNNDSLSWGLEPIGLSSIHDELWETNQSVEVIGNIHENKELLGGEK